MIPHIKQESEGFTIEYPEAQAFMDTQLTKCFWTHQEVNVEQDIHSILTDCTEAERHGIETVLRLFTLYEVKAGEDYWTGRFMKSFPRHEFCSMAAAFGMMELCVHKIFYTKINDLLNASDPDFYTAYKQDVYLNDRMKSIDSIINDQNDLVSLAGFVFIEGVVLYSSFAFLKHFQSNGKNKLMNIVRGINFSARDENLHAEAGAWTFRNLYKQSELTQYENEYLESIINDIVQVIRQHEYYIIEQIFSKGDIQGISMHGMKSFVNHRLNKCLGDLGLDFSINEDNEQINPIKDWFYAGINNYQHNDFFTSVGREYVRKWNQESFIWNT